MKSPKIVTLTLNPAIDGSYDVDRVIPTNKLRSHGERYEPGGGGINVARIIAALGGHVEAWFLAGGATGDAFEKLLAERGIARRRFGISGPTRIAMNAYERETGKEYRFVPRGPEISEAEWRAALSAMERLDAEWLVASGSLPAGVPSAFYGDLARHCARRGIGLVLDTSGPALGEALAAGGLLLVKPSLSEFERLSGRAFTGTADIAAAARQIVRSGAARIVAVTLGHEGAVLAHADGVHLLPAAQVPVRSAVGAGDSFLGAMVLALAQGLDLLEAFRWGAAAGAATVMSPGTGLSTRAQIEQCLVHVAQPAPLA